MMDRDKKDKLPVMQVNFIDQICMPVYKVSVRITKSEKWKHGIMRYLHVYLFPQHIFSKEFISPLCCQYLLAFNNASTISRHCYK